MMLFFNSHSTDKRTKSIWQRKNLAPYENQTLQFTGIPIEHIKYGKNLTQIVIASVYGCDNANLELDHVCVIVTNKHVNQFSLYQPVIFYATVHKYKTTEYIKLDTHGKTLPALTDNYTLVKPQHMVSNVSYQLRHPMLSKYLKNRLIILHDQTNNNVGHLESILSAGSNDGRREEFIAPYLDQLKHGANRINIYQTLKDI